MSGDQSKIAAFSIERKHGNSNLGDEYWLGRPSGEPSPGWRSILPGGFQSALNDSKRCLASGTQTP